MTPEEVAAWEAMARDGTLGRWVKQEEEPGWSAHGGGR